jgi:hypothetical protein
MPLVAIPLAYWAVGGLIVAAGATVAWQQSDGPQKTAEALNSLAHSMQGANEEANTQNQTAPIADTCTGNCPPPPGCKDKNDKIKERRDEVEKRSNDLLEDKKSLFYDYFSEASPHPDGSGSWEGHIRQYQDKQKNLRRLIQDALNGGCKVESPDAEEWATNEPPGAPKFKWPRLD